MAKQTINVGTVPDDGSGDTVRNGMIKVNENTTELYNAIASVPEAYLKKTYINGGVYTSSANEMLLNSSYVGDAKFKTSHINQSLSHSFYSPYSAVHFKTAGIKFEDLTLWTPDRSTSGGAAIFFQDVADTSASKMALRDHEYGLWYKDSVISYATEVYVSNCDVGVRLEGGSNAGNNEGTTVTEFKGLTVNGCGIGLELSGVIALTTFQGGSFESLDTLFSVDSGQPLKVEGMKFDNVWFESITDSTLKDVLAPVFDHCLFNTSDNTMTGGVHPIFRDPRSASGKLLTSLESSTVENLSNLKEDKTGLSSTELAFPQIGSASTLVEQHYKQGSAQSLQVARLSSPLFSYCPDSISNLMLYNLDHAGGWPYDYDNIVVTGGQADMYGGTSAVKLDGDGGTLSLPTAGGTAGEWMIVQWAVKANIAGAILGTWCGTTNAGGTQDKRAHRHYGDTEWRIDHMLVKLDGASTGVDVHFRVDNAAHSFTVHRVCAYPGTQLRPMLDYGQSATGPFFHMMGKVYSELQLKQALNVLDGVTGSRPGTPYLWQKYRDTTLGYTVEWNGTNWVNGVGTTV